MQIGSSLDTLGVGLLLGRTFTPEEDVPSGPDLAVLGYGLWSRRYGSDPSLVGRSILIDGRTTHVIGVMPRDFMLPTDFQNPEPTQLWTPLQIDPASTDYGNHGLYATREIGIRLAIGAGRGQVLRMVLRRGLMLSLMRIAAGIVGAVFLTRIMTGLLHGVSARDPVTFVAVTVGLSAVALVASLVPAWRATRVDPVIALKTE